MRQTYARLLAASLILFSVAASIGFAIIVNNWSGKPTESQLQIRSLLGWL